MRWAGKEACERVSIIENKTFHELGVVLIATKGETSNDLLRGVKS